ncbi:AAA family ATPase [Aeromonas veronii]|uniref:AbiJ-related protein n=1 Tax=Aeromonas veronii TaxID=654 RepID=UPI003D201210
MISRLSRSKILDFILNATDVFEFAKNNDEGIVPFLNEIWDLKSMPSEDIRFSNAERDIIQHTVNNDDWSWKELFESRLKIQDDADKFKVFLDVLLSPKYQRNVDTTFKLIEKINSLLNEDGVVFITASYENDFPIFELVTMDSVDRPVDIPVNKIPFFVIPYPEVWLDKYVNHLRVDNDKPSQYFVLIADNWDDYNYKTTFCMVYFDNGKKELIGYVKIGSKKNATTTSVIPSDFSSLEDGFFSLGQSTSYYKKMRELFGNRINSVLYSLRDVAFFADLSEEYESLEIFRVSLIRDDAAERLLRTAKPMVYGRSLDSLYSFEYSFHPKYSDTSVLVPFHFSPDGFLPKRIIALIGKNGAGKTQLLTTLPQDIANGNSDSLIPQKPMYSKVIAVSYSTFDNFDIPKKTSEFNYVYCGLRDEKGDIRSRKGQLQKFHNTWKKISKLGRLEKWKKVISNFIDAELIDLFIKSDASNNSQLYFDMQGFGKARESLSSGQSIVLFVVSEIVANIRYDSLLLFDEPETHLHPNAISQLMNGIAELVSEFESYCIIATHSPIIIQELFSRDVLVISREGNIPSVKRIGIESFGENLSVITEEIFGNRTIPKFYESTVKKLVKVHKSYEKIINIMKEGSLPLGLNVRLYIQSQVKKDAEN